MGIFRARDYPDGRPRWVARYKLGPRRWRRLEFDSRQTAERHVLDQGPGLNDFMLPAMSLATVIDWFLREHRGRNLDESTTLREYRSRLHRWLLGQLGSDTAMGALRPADYVAVLEAMHAAGRQPVTVMKTFGVIRQLVTAARIRGFITLDPVSPMLPALAVPRRYRYAAPPRADHLRRIRAAANPALRLMLSLMTELGIEPCEQRRLRRTDVALGPQTLFVRELPLPGDPPEAPYGRSVRMTATVLADAGRWLALTGGAPQDLVFPAMLDAHRHTMAFHAVQREAGLWRAGAHCKRYGLYPVGSFLLLAAEAQAAAGKDLKTISADFGFVTTSPMHRRVGWKIEARAAKKADRTRLAAARRGQGAPAWS